MVLVGENDQAIDGEKLRAVFAADAPRAEVAVVPGISHLGISTDKSTLEKMAAWLKALPPAPK